MGMLAGINPEQHECWTTARILVDAEAALSAAQAAEGVVLAKHIVQGHSPNVIRLPIHSAGITHENVRLRCS